MPDLKERIRSLAKGQLAAAELDLQSSISAITKRGLTILLVLAISALVAWLPGSGVLLPGHVSLVALLTLAIAVAAVVLLLAVYRPVVCALSHVVRAVFQVPPEHACDRSVPRVAWCVAFLAYVCLVYWIFMRAFMPVLALLSSKHWPLTVIDIFSLTLCVAAIVGIVSNASPLLGKVGDSLASHIAPEPGDAGIADSIPQATCPQCHVLYETGSRFCSFCGYALTAKTPPDKPNES